ncbi:MAG: ClpXP protease specificity-enhancing factor SspB [Rickettsiales bacterium]|jgi:hypothetical protein|nr:ClpXP protease specificity-enhancing factor SspB [Rickettsiales bacterium]
MKTINYGELLNNALKGVVREALQFAMINGLDGDTNFYITFNTRTPGVVIPDFLRMRYPNVMTIVLQYAFSNLNVNDTEFGVTLTFDGRPFYIRIPFDALLEFKDTSVDFILPFNPINKKDEKSANNDIELPLETGSENSDTRVISLEDYRKKKLKKL